MVERLYEDQTIQDNMKAPVKAANIDKRSKKFKVLISQGNVKDALKLLIHNMPNRALRISNETQDLLKQKPPEPLKLLPWTLLQDVLSPLHRVTYEEFDGSLVMRAEMLTKRGSGQSDLDTDGWSRILTSRQFGISLSGLGKAFQTLLKTDVQKNSNLKIPLKKLLQPTNW